MKLPHIVFLDFDGPLFSQKALLMPENNAEGSIILKELNLHPFVSYWKADPMAVAMLKDLYHIRHFQLVISSSWADEQKHNKEQIVRLLKINDIDIPLHNDWRTPRTVGESEKSQEILKWLQNNKYSDYLILDDHDSCDNLSNDKIIKDIGIDKNKILLVDVEDGLSMRNYYQLQAIVKNWN